MIRVLIADDHAVVRQGLRQILTETSDMNVTGEAANGLEALERARADEYDVAVLDITMPGRSGFDILKELRGDKPKLPVLILSMHAEEQFAVRLLKAGAAGYLNKESAPEELVKAIRKVVSGGRYVSPALAEKLAFEMDYWPMELYKLSLAPPEAEFSRQIGLVTGAARGIGKSIAEKMVHNGAHVFLADLNVKAASTGDATYLSKGCLYAGRKGVFCRNLQLTRYIHGPLVYGETLYQDNLSECLLLNLESDKLKNVRVQQADEAYFKGIKEYVENWKK